MTRYPISSVNQHNIIAVNFQISSLLSMSASSLRDLLCDPKGCHVADAFAESDSVGEKSRDGLVKALKVTSIQFGLFHICFSITQ